jgi:hypothetical protein
MQDVVYCMRRILQGGAGRQAAGPFPRAAG